MKNKLNLKNKKVLPTTLAVALSAGLFGGGFALLQDNDASASKAPQLNVSEKAKKDSEKKNKLKENKKENTIALKNVDYKKLSNYQKEEEERRKHSSTYSSPTVENIAAKIVDDERGVKTTATKPVKIKSIKVAPKTKSKVVTASNNTKPKTNANKGTQNVALAATHKVNNKPKVNPAWAINTNNAIDLSKTIAKSVSETEGVNSRIPNTPFPSHVPTVTATIKDGDAAKVRSMILALAASQEGVPYVWGGTTPGVGLDCSGLTQWVYSQIGVHLPRTADQQYHAVQQIRGEDAKPGDLVFLHDASGHVYHVGILVDFEKKLYWEENRPGGGGGLRSFAYAANSAWYGTVFNDGSGDVDVKDINFPKANVVKSTPVPPAAEPRNYDPEKSRKANKPVSDDTKNNSSLNSLPKVKDNKSVTQKPADPKPTEKPKDDPKKDTTKTEKPKDNKNTDSKDNSKPEDTKNSSTPSATPTPSSTSSTPTPSSTSSSNTPTPSSSTTSSTSSPSSATTNSSSTKTATPSSQPTATSTSAPVVPTSTPTR